MATTTFNKDFTLAERDVKNFYDTMQASDKPIIDKDYKSALVSEEKYRSALVEALKK